MKLWTRLFLISAMICSTAVLACSNKEFGTSETFTKLKENVIRFFKNILPG